MKPKKSLGQHFLRSTSFLDRIVEALEPVAGEEVVEIGPGQGALTERLLAAGFRVAAVEIDRDLLEELRGRFAGSAFSLREGDAVTLDYSVFGERFKVAGNLPYGSATAITDRLMEYAARAPLMVLMYQREVAQRVAAAPGSRSYGYLSCLVQFHCLAEYLMTIPPGAFWPAPKVHSGVVRLRPRPALPLPPEEKEDLFALIRGAFAQRRKKIANALAAAGPSMPPRDWIKAELEGWGVDAERRPETFSLEEFILIRKIIGRWKGAGAASGGRA